MAEGIHAVTGAFGFSGRYIARRLLDAGCRVVTLTNSLNRPNPFGDRVKALPLAWDNPEKLVESLRGVSVLYNTYWVRFNHRTFTYASAEANALTLFRAAQNAHVQRIVHVSISNPAEDSPLEYFRRKARVERALKELGVSYCILRPAVLFGREDILINNIAWGLRRFPVFAIFGDGSYRLCPIYVDDLAEIAVDQGARSENAVIEAIGPETFTYDGLVRTIAGAIGRRPLLLHAPPALCFGALWFMGKLLGDVLLTRDEIRGLVSGLLYVDAPPSGKTKLTDWLYEHAASLGTRYASELGRRADRSKLYEE